jgi:hypothetical protein
LHYIDWNEVLTYYLFFNKIISPPGWPNSSNLCLLTDVIEDKEDPYSTEVQEMEAIGYPIAIRISPYASLRDILDYVKKTYKVAIEPIQGKYRNKDIKIGKIKPSNGKIQERNQFIYQNRDKTGKELKRLVYEKFGDNLPYEYIPKIISREKKKKTKSVAHFLR